jgi:hypothetical protein
MNGVGGDFDKLAKWARRLESASGSVRAIPPAVAPTLVADARAAVEAGTTLEGASLEDQESTFKRGTSAPLQRSGALAASAIGVTEGNRVGVRFAVDYARFALRRFWPSSLPKKWATALREESLTQIRRRLDGAT